MAEQTIRIYHTNDVHSRFTQFARVVAYVKENKHPEDMFLDGGDMCDLTHLIVEGTGGKGAIRIMQEAGIDISGHTPYHVNYFLHQSWDYVITVCGGANESCPAFIGDVRHRLHIGFDDPSKTEGSDDFVLSEFRRVREEIKKSFYHLYQKEIYRQ